MKEKTSRFLRINRQYLPNIYFHQRSSCVDDQPGIGLPQQDLTGSVTLPDYYAFSVFCFFSPVDSG